MYRTTDLAADAHNHRQQATSKLLASLKSIVQKEKNNAVSQHNFGLTIKEKPTAHKKPEERAPVWHLATFSSPEQLAQIKEKQLQLTHETMLQKELTKFRSEVEAKFRSSETNRTFVYPRQLLEMTSRDEQDTVKRDTQPDCMNTPG